MGVLYDETEIAILEFPTYSGSGPLFSVEGDIRQSSLYGQTGVPSSWFDGVYNQYGTTGSVAGDLNAFNNYFHLRTTVSSPLQMDIMGSFGSDSGHFTTTIIVVDPVSGYSNLRFMFAVVEDSIYYPWSNGVNWHHNIARDLVPDGHLHRL